MCIRDRFSGQDTADVSYFSHFTSGLLIERNTLNRKQHANAGESLAGSIRVVTGHETTDLGSTRAENLMDHHYNHDWIVAKITLDKYFLPRGIFKFCLLYTSPSPRDRTRSRMPSSA